MIVLGSIGSLAGTLILLALVMAGIWTPWSLFLPTSLGAFSQGLALPNAQAAAISVDPRAAGAASGLSGFLQMGLAGLAAQIVGTLENGTPYPMVIGMTFCAIISLLCALRRRNRPPGTAHKALALCAIATLPACRLR